MTDKEKKDYPFPKFSGCLTGRLVYKESNNKFIMLYFHNTDCKSKLAKYVLLAWATGTDSYKLSGIDFADLPLGTVCKCGFDVTQNENGQQTKLNYVKLPDNAADAIELYARQFFFMLIKRAYPRCLIANLTVKKLLDNVVYLSAIDNSYNTCYEVTRQGDNWQIRRYKSGDSEVKDTVITIDGKSYGVLTKEYK